MCVLLRRAGPCHHRAASTKQLGYQAPPSRFRPMRAFNAASDLFTGLIFQTFGRMPPGLTAKGSGLGRGQGTAIPGPPEGLLGDRMLEGGLSGRE